MKIFENLQRIKEREKQSKKYFIEKLLILFFALQYEKWFVDIQTKVIAFFCALLVIASLYGALRLFCYLIILIP